MPIVMDFGCAADRAAGAPPAAGESTRAAGLAHPAATTARTNRIDLTLVLLGMPCSPLNVFGRSHPDSSALTSPAHLSHLGRRTGLALNRGAAPLAAGVVRGLLHNLHEVSAWIDETHFLEAAGIV